MSQIAIAFPSVSGKEVVDECDRISVLGVPVACRADRSYT